MSKEKKLQIRNSTAEFLIFTRQAGEDGIEVRVAEETVWLTQKLMAALFEVDVRTVSEHLRNVCVSGELQEAAVIRKFRNTATDGKQYLTAFSPCKLAEQKALKKSLWRRAFNVDF